MLRRLCQNPPNRPAAIRQGVVPVLVSAARPATLPFQGKCRPPGRSRFPAVPLLLPKLSRPLLPVNLPAADPRRHHHRERHGGVAADRGNRASNPPGLPVCQHPTPRTQAAHPTRRPAQAAAMLAMLAGVDAGAAAAHRAGVLGAVRQLLTRHVSSLRAVEPALIIVREILAWRATACVFCVPAPGAPGGEPQPNPREVNPTRDGENPAPNPAGVLPLRAPGGPPPRPRSPGCHPG